MRKTLAALSLAAILAVPAFSFAADKPAAENPDKKAYPAVVRAIEKSQDAIAALEAVKADLGAHKAAAAEALNKAITEIKAGLDEAKAKKAAPKK
jgi:hypothetical protein